MRQQVQWRAGRNGIVGGRAKTWRSPLLVAGVVAIALVVATAAAAGYNGVISSAKQTSVASTVQPTVAPAHKAAPSKRRRARATKKSASANASKKHSAGTSTGASKTVSAKRTTTSTKKTASASTARKHTVAANPLAAYKGLASWVDLYDDKAWANPEATVRDMASHGVRTLFIETSNFHSSSGVMNAAKLKTFITACHKHDMKVVAWYLPNMAGGSTDFTRVMQAIDFKAGNQRFDSFALDIESDAVGSVSTRNRNLETLTKRIRAKVGSSYPLGAIIPSPVGLAKGSGYWNSFPYAMCARYYDVFVPMAYYSYHTHSASGALADTLGNVRILRSQPGCKNKPIHLIGGISENSSTAQVHAFVQAVKRTSCYGASLYGWPGTTSAAWRELKALM
jgi:hypothetical protein